MLYKSERKVIDSGCFSGKKLTSATFESLRKGARHTLKKIASQFDITKFKLQKRPKKMVYEKWEARHEKCVRLSAEWFD